MRNLLPALFLLVLSHAPALGVSVQYRRGPDAPEEVLDWFRSRDLLLHEIESLSPLLVAGAAGRAPDAALEVWAKVKEITPLYGKVTGDTAGVRDVLRSVDEVYKILKVLTAQDQVPPEGLHRLYSLEPGSLHRSLQQMRQAGLEAAGPSGRFPVNALVTFTDKGKDRELAFMDLGKSGEVSVALGGFIEAAQGLAKPEGSFIVGPSRVWLRVRGASLYADFVSRRQGDVLLVRYEEYDGTTVGQAGFYFLTKTLLEAGYAVSVRNGGLLARAGVEISYLDWQRRADLFAYAWNAVEVSHAIRPLLAEYLRGTLSQEENAQRLDELSAVFAAEGRIPFLQEEGGLAAGLKKYRSLAGARESLRSDMGGTLSRLGLGEFPPEVGVGQRTIDIHFNRPVRAAIARGEVVMKQGKLALNWRYDPLSLLAVVTPAERGSLLVRRPPGRMVTLGTVSRFLAQRFQTPAGNQSWHVSYLLRDPRSGLIHWFGTSLVHEDDPNLKIEGVAGFHTLREAQPGERGREGLVAVDNDVFFADTVVGSREPGRFKGRISYEKGPSPVEKKIFITPYLTTVKWKDLQTYGAVVTTSEMLNNLVLASLAGIPHLNLGQADWSPGMGIILERPVLGKPRKIGQAIVRSVAGTQRIALREGDAVGLDIPTGFLQVLAQ